MFIYLYVIDYIFVCIIYIFINKDVYKINTPHN